MQVNRHELALGTGFVVRRNEGAFLITNRHNVRGRRNDDSTVLSTTGGVPDSVVIRHNLAGALGLWIAKTERLYDRAGNPLWREHPVIGGDIDVVALPLTDVSGIQLYPYDPWAQPVPIRAGPSDLVSIVGFPFGASGGGALAIWVQGSVASEPGIDRDGLPLFLIDSRTRPGSSGSPVIAYRSGGMISLEDGSSVMYAGPVWRLLGVYSGRITAEADLGCVWKARVISEIVDTGSPGTP